MSRIIEKHDDDKEYIFTCPICGTVFTEKERNIHEVINDGYRNITYNVFCPNCNRTTIYPNMEEYKHE